MYENKFGRLVQSNGTLFVCCEDFLLPVKLGLLRKSSDLGIFDYFLERGICSFLKSLKDSRLELLDRKN